MSALSIRLRSAVESWCENYDWLAFRKNWTGDADGSDPDEPCVALVQYARQVACDPKDAGLTKALQVLRKADHDRAARSLFGEKVEGRNNRDVEILQQQLLQAAGVLQGLVATVSAARGFRAANDNVTPDVIEQIKLAALSYTNAWPLLKQVVPPNVNLFHDPPAGTRILLDTARSFVSEERITVTTWLILRRLLATLLGETDGNAPASNRLPMLLYGSDGQGHVGPLTIRAVAEGQWGFYPDPLAFGVTVIDESMLKSLTIAWRACDESVRALGDPTQPVALRLVPDFPVWVKRLEGGSAGGLFACGMFATANRQNLDPRRTASCALKLESVNPDSSGPLQPGRVRLAKVGHLAEKLKAAAEKGIVEVVAEGEQVKAEFPDRLPHLEPRLTGVDTLAAVYETLRGDARYESVIERFADQVHAEWDEIAEAGANSDALLRDLNETHRFDCYITPTYRVERPRRTGEFEDTDGSGAPGHRDWLRLLRADEDLRDQEGDRVRVPGAVDEPLVNLLSLMLGTTVWDGAPDWLCDAQADGPRWLVVYDNAGSGKTVFSFRAKHVLTSAGARQRFFGDRAPVVVRWEGRWPRDSHGDHLPVVEALAQQMARNLGAQFADEGALQGLRRCMRYALDLRRVVVILDGFDQFLPEDREQFTTLLQREGRGDPDAVRCRWIITSRVHAIDERRAKLFDDSRFARVRIETLGQESQDEYFEKRGIGPRWQEVIGINSDDPRDTVRQVRARMDELLQLPMTLWLIGELIDLNSADRPLPRFHTLSELALTVSRKLLQRARERSLAAIERELARENVAPIALDESQQLELLEHVLTLIAFQLMLDQEYNGRVDGSALPDFEKRCQRRYVHKVNEALLRERRKNNDADPNALYELDEELQRRRRYWVWALAVLKTIELNYRSVTEAYQPSQLAFRSRKMVECHAARYLTRYATEWDIFAPDCGDDERCAWNFVNDPEWKECWLLAIDMPRFARPFRDPREVIDEDVTRRSLSALLRPPKSGVRPTELIYSAWHLFEIDDRLLRQRRFPVEGRSVIGEDLAVEERIRLGERLLLPRADVVVKDYRRTGKIVTDSFETLAGDPDSWPARQQRATAAEKSQWFVQCPPQAWIAAFERDNRPRDPLSSSDPLIGVMGASETELHHYEQVANAVPERPRHRVRLQPFEIQATVVTCAQYRVFDPHFEERLRLSKHLFESGKNKLAEDAAVWNSLPVVRTSFYDAFAYSKWLGQGYELPTDCQAEFAIRAGTETAFHFGSALNGTDANCNGEKPYGQIEKGPYLRHPTVVGNYPPNAFGVYDAHGNVMVWCWDRYEPNQPEQRTPEIESSTDPVIHEADAGPPDGQRRILCSGSWYSRAFCCRAAFRRTLHPANSSDNIGIRVIRRPAQR